MEIAPLTMKFFTTRGHLLLLTAVLGLFLGACSRFLPARVGLASSAQMVIDTRRGPYETLTGCFIPAVFPAVTKIPVVWVQKIPADAVFTSVSVAVVAKNGEISLLEPYIENNQVFIKFAVPSIDSFSQYNIVVSAKYKYR
jgi:hypothetical protein